MPRAAHGQQRLHPRLMRQPPLHLPRHQHHQSCSEDHPSPAQPMHRRRLRRRLTRRRTIRLLQPRVPRQVPTSWLVLPLPTSPRLAIDQRGPSEAATHPCHPQGSGQVSRPHRNHHPARMRGHAAPEMAQRWAATRRRGLRRIAATKEWHQHRCRQAGKRRHRRNCCHCYRLCRRRGAVCLLPWRWRSRRLHIRRAER